MKYIGDQTQLIDSELVKVCHDNLGSEFSERYVKQLKSWYLQSIRKESSFKKLLLLAPMAQWGRLIFQHNAHHHQWYQFLSSTIDIDNMASFLLENKYYPTFLKLLEKIREVQILPEAKAAVQENIDDEFEPEPHAQLMWKLMMAVKNRAKQPVEIDYYPVLIDRTLIFYYGYYVEPWHLVGAVFATEQMGVHRVTLMKQCLQRLGLNEDELAFTTVHSECDDHHADDWLQRVIIPTLNQRPELKLHVVSGIAECLESSERYLDFLLERAQRRMGLNAA